MQPKKYFPGFLVAIEGIDGAGKTTQSHFLQDALQALKFSTVRTKEPTQGQYGQQLRDSALTGRLSADEEIELFMKDRAEHVKKLIIPALEFEQIVIVDRYYFSTAAYQGSRGYDPEKLMADNEKFAPEPDLLIVIDIDPKVGLDRIRMRGDRANHFEVTSTLEKARLIFKEIKRPYKYVVDGSQSSEAIRKEILLEFKRCYLEAVAASDKAPQDKLNATLALFGADPVD